MSSIEKLGIAVIGIVVTTAAVAFTGAIIVVIVPLGLAIGTGAWMVYTLRRGGGAALAAVAHRAGFPTWAAAIGPSPPLARGFLATILRSLVFRLPDDTWLVQRLLADLTSRMTMSESIRAVVGTNVKLGEPETLSQTTTVDHDGANNSVIHIVVPLLHPRYVICGTLAIDAVARTAQSSGGRGWLRRIFSEDNTVGGDSGTTQDKIEIVRVILRTPGGEAILVPELATASTSSVRSGKSSEFAGRVIDAEYRERTR